SSGPLPSARRWPRGWIPLLSPSHGSKPATSTGPTPSSRGRRRCTTTHRPPPIGPESRRCAASPSGSRPGKGGNGSRGPRPAAVSPRLLGGLGRGAAHLLLHHFLEPFALLGHPGRRDADHARVDAELADVADEVAREDPDDEALREHAE